jgi:hypothetical protein
MLQRDTQNFAKVGCSEQSGRLFVTTARRSVVCRPGLLKLSSIFIDLQSSTHRYKHKLKGDNDVRRHGTCSISAAKCLTAAQRETEPETVISKRVALRQIALSAI